jgi:hypothetical protein
MNPFEGFIVPPWLAFYPRKQKISSKNPTSSALQGRQLVCLPFEKPQVGEKGVQRGGVAYQP